ncbi:UDP-N-acetylglucosamine 2-epimerase [Marinicrinis sediminis]|uniref:UDP-N-acetylglucosamine 2-epimerase n=1 Tax=Marinicrinis sediminis TaxID=1652465 RepID=A0ABW5R799_9BACL
MIRILCITGTRADYGIYRPLLLAMQQDASIDLHIVATGMHVLQEYGHTVKAIEQDGLAILSRPLTIMQGDALAGMSKSLALCLLHFADLFADQAPDLILVLGDRGEMLAAAIAAHYQNIGIVHLHGGEKSGSADDGVRQAISAFAHLHYVSSLEARHRLVQLGEEEWRIFPIGSLRKKDLHEVRQMPAQRKAELVEQYGLQGDQKKMLLVMHPDSKDSTAFAAQITPVLAALRQLEEARQGSIICIGANSDAGGRQFNRELMAYVREHPRARYYPSIPAHDYLFLLSAVDVLIGNSSSGIIEAPFFQLPFVHIGHRQRNRTRGDNVIDCEADADAIQQAIRKALSLSMRDSESHNPYDLTGSPENVMLASLKQMIHHPQLRMKQM